jgi:hypothetical protein
MQQCELSLYLSRQQGRVFVVRLHDETLTVERAKVIGEGQRDARPVAAKGRVCDGVPAELGHEGDARILDAPKLFRMKIWLWQKRWLIVDEPTIDPVRGASGAKVRVAAPVFYAAQEECCAVSQPGSPWIEDRVCGIGPIGCG